MTSCGQGSEYSLYDSDGTLFMLEASSGKVWKYSSRWENDGAVHTWINIGTPPDDAPKKGDQYKTN